MDIKEIRATEAMCTEEHAPACTAGCPLHIDMRGIIAQIRQGDMDKAAAIYAPKAQFPRILSRLCDAPCEKVCIRNLVDKTVSIGALERSLLEYFPKPKAIRPVMRIKKRVAVVGAGLSGLSAALYLASKGFSVKIYEKNQKIGWQFEGIKGLSSKEIEEDFAALLDFCEVEKGLKIGEDINYDEIISQYDALFFSGELPPDNKEKLDLELFRLGESKLFAAGRRLCGHNSPVRSISEGRRAAITMERFLTKVSLTAARVNEGPYETDLYVEIENAPLIEPVEEKGIYSFEEAGKEARRCLDCHCLVCVRQCKFLEKFEEFPRKYIREIANTISLVGAGMRRGRDLLTSCSLCGLCQEVCPNEIAFPEVIHSGRRIMVEKNEFPPAIYDYPIRDMQYANSGEGGLCRHAPGKEKSLYVFFPGCQLPTCDPDIIIPAYKHLLKWNPETGLILGCCGAPADWAGQAPLYEETIENLKGRLLSLKGSGEELPVLITACPTCERQLNAAGIKTLSLWNILAAEKPAKADLAEGKELPLSAKVSIHDSCTARYDTKMQNSIREILKNRGYEIEELGNSREKTKCCGYGGLVFYGNRDIANAMIEDLANQSPLPYITYCSVCRDYLAREGKSAVHILDLLFGKGEPHPPVGLSQKEYNRNLVKNKILKDLYGESVAEEKLFPLYISEDLRAKMDNSLITEANLREVINRAEKSGEKFIHTGNGHFIAGLRPKIITYWVEYAPQGEGYEIFAAYSHRIQVEREDEKKDTPLKYTPVDEAPHINCAIHNKPLELHEARAYYLKSEFPTSIPSCPVCRQFYISEGLARGKMAEIERTQEIK